MFKAYVVYEYVKKFLSRVIFAAWDNVSAMRAPIDENPTSIVPQLLVLWYDGHRTKPGCGPTYTVNS